ncbi:MAG TPA: hypothetical protein VH107_04215 [Lacipirellulaceae bacterium]|nr:hypothetical protein [Lacipirellulaceae bacterium]
MAETDLIAPPTIRVAVTKPKFGIYYALLIIALCAMLVSCGVLYKYVKDFGGFGAVKGKISASELHTPYSVAASGVRAPSSRSISSSAAGSSFTS